MLKHWLGAAWAWLTRRFARRPKPYTLHYVEGDELPDTLPPRILVVAREGDILWAAGLTCPCGCGRRIELMLLPNVKPRWDLLVGARGVPSLRPSVWVKKDCRAHFWLRDGQIQWC